MRLYNTILKKQAGEKKKRRRRILTILTAILIVSLFVQSFALSANTPKEEVVYINLDRDGSVDAIYVVNSFDLDQDGRIIDYGDYTAFREMTSSGKIQTENEMITIDANAGKLYYEGTLKNDSIPWLFDIRYLIDGKEYKADKIAGESGKLEIRMSVSPNPKSGRDFFDHYTLQAAFKLDTSICKNIRAEGATIANAGKDKQLLFTILPGKKSDITVRADVTDFEMEGIAINGISMDMAFDLGDDPSMTKKLRDLKDGVRKLDDGAVELRDGAKELAEGTGDLKTGVIELSEGALELTDGTGKLADGANELSDGSKEMLSGAKEIYDGMDALSDGLGRLSSGSGTLMSGAGQIFDSTLAAANAQLQASPGGITELTRTNFDQVLNGMLEQIGGYAYQQAMVQAEYGIRTTITDDLIEKLRSEYPDQSPEEITAIIEKDEQQQAQIAAMVSQQLQIQEAAILESVQAGLSENQNYIALYTLKAQLTGISDFYNGLASYTNGVSRSSRGAYKLVSGMKEWRDGVSEFNDGIIDFKDATVELNDGVIELKDGVIKLLSGAVELHDGTLEFYDGSVTLASGTLEFRDKTANIENDMKNIIKKKIDEMMGGKFKPISFVSNKNTNVLSVQFTMQTEEIRIPLTETAPIEPTKELTLLDRLLALFRF